MSAPNLADKPDDWWKTPELENLATAEMAVDDALAAWQRLRQQVEKRVVREWQLSPQAPVFMSHHAFLTALNEAVDSRADVQEAWQNFVDAVRRQHDALCAWVEQMNETAEA